MTTTTLTADSEELVAPLPLQIVIARKLCTEEGALACEHCVAAAARLMPTATGGLDVLEKVVRAFGEPDDEGNYSDEETYSEVRTAMRFLVWAGRMEKDESVVPNQYRFPAKGE